MRTYFPLTGKNEIEASRYSRTITNVLLCTDEFYQYAGLILDTIGEDGQAMWPKEDV